MTAVLPTRTDIARALNNGTLNRLRPIPCVETSSALQPVAPSAAASRRSARRGNFDPMLSVSTLAPLPESAERAAVELPEARSWAGSMAMAIVEVLFGVRSRHQIQRWVSEEVWTAVLDRTSAPRIVAGPAAPRRGARTLRVRCCEPSTGVCEASAVVYDGARVRGVAMRMQSYRGRWLITALQIG